MIIPQTYVWKDYEKILFRFFFIYFLLHIIPLDPLFYTHLFNIDWTGLSFSELFNIAKYTPQFISGHYDPDNWGLATLQDWGFIFLLALTGTLIWSYIDKKNTSYTKLYAWLRILIRYRLAIAVIAYGFLKLFALQAPYPSISSLNTPYGNFTSWKLFSLSLGIVPGYQSFLGVVELLAGIFLLFRRTATIGATIIIFFTGNVMMSNLAYEGGEAIYSLYLVTLALFLVAFDALRIVNLLVLRKPVAPARFSLALSRNNKLIFRGIKIFIISVFVVFYGFSVSRSANKGGYHFPNQTGLKGFSGLYDVASFQLNNQVLPYSTIDTVRWKDVVFEKWAAISIGVNSATPLLNEDTEKIPVTNSSNRFEESGAIGRKYYTYTADTINHVLKLQNDADSAQSILFKYTLQPDSSIQLSGKINQDSVKVTLQKNNHKYLLKATEKGRRSSLKL